MVVGPAISPEQVVPSAGRTGLPLAGAIALGLGLVGALFSVAVGGLSWGLASPTCAAVLFTTIGTYLAVRVGIHGISGLFLTAGAAWSSGLALGGYGEMGLARGWPGATEAFWVSTWLWPLGLIAPLCLVPLSFPDGRAVSPRWRVFNLTAWVAVVSCMLASAFAPGPMTTGSGPGPHNPLGVAGEWTAWLSLVGQIAIAIALAAGFAALVVRWRSGVVELRQQLKYLIAAMLFTGLVEILAVAQSMVGHGPGALTQLLLLLIPVAIVGAVGLAVARYRLYDIDGVIRTGVQYTVLIGLLLAAYAALVTGLTSLTVVVAEPAIPVIAALSVALLLEPTRRWLHVRLGRWLFGGRSEPMRVLADLRRQLAAEGASTAALSIVARSVATAVRSPSVAIVLRHDDGDSVAARSGDDPGGPSSGQEFPLVHRGELVGRLLVAPRRRGEQFNAADRALLIEMAGQAGAVAGSVRLADDLAIARRRAYLASVEERDRLGRDLHDGLAPLLAGTNLAVEGVRRTLAPEDPAFGSLTTIRRQIRTASDEVRRIARSLSPGPLSELGLAGALEDFAQGLRTVAGPTITVATTVPVLISPAIDEVAYLVVLEATTNALRHARSSSIHIGVGVEDGDLVASVVDDGVGLGSSYIAGVGLASMRHRCDAVGGLLCIDSEASRGTVVRAILPIGAR